MLEGITALADETVAADVQAFFAEHEVPQGAKQLAQHLERQRAGVALRAATARPSAAALRLSRQGSSSPLRDRLHWRSAEEQNEAATATARASTPDAMTTPSGGSSPPLVVTSPPSPLVSVAGDLHHLGLGLDRPERRHLRSAAGSAGSASLTVKGRRSGS